MSIKQMIADIIAKEGSYVNHHNDKGGPTNYGITAMSYAEYFKRQAADITIAEIKAVTPQLAEKIYYTLYYVRPGIDLLPDLIQPIMLDMAVNHGRRGSIKTLQNSLIDVAYSIAIPDGIIGNRTLSATNKAVDQLGGCPRTNMFINGLQYIVFFKSFKTLYVVGELVKR